MARIVADRVKDTSTTTGTGTFTVSGSAPTGFRTFSAVCSTSDTFFYCIEDTTTGDWETGLGTYSGSNQVARTTVYASSNAGSAVNFAAGSKNVFMTLPAAQWLGKSQIPVPASAMTARTTNGAASGTVETSTNKVMLVTLDFDATTQEFAQFAMPMPSSWNEGTVTFRAVWSHPSTTTNFGVAWQLQAVAFADGDALDTAFGTAVVVTDTGGTTDTLYRSAESSAITVAGSPGAGEYVVFQVARKPADAADTMAVDARLHAIELFLTTEDGVDA